MGEDIEWLVQTINTKRDSLRQRLESGRGTDNETTFNEGMDWALKHVLKMIGHLDKYEALSQDLPVIPKYVADWIEEAKEKNYPLAYAINRSKGELGEWLHSWGTEENQDLFAEAWLDGYEVEEEQKYCVNDGNNILLCKWKSPDGWRVISTVESANRGLHFAELDLRLTEHEIKDFDPRYWAFRKPIDKTDNE